MAATVFGGRWQVVRTIGEGGQAHAFTVVDVSDSNGRIYVLKRLKNRNRIDRFAREATAISQLEHENVLRLVDLQIDDASAFIVTEYCKGGSLDRSSRYWRSSPSDLFSLFDQICAGVAFAHARGVIHRDLKPANIFLRGPNGPAVVGDFGLCFLEADERLTLTAEAVGSRLFMAPELEGGRMDAVSQVVDTYALGKLLYWLVADQVFPREAYREERWDLKGRNADSRLGWNNIYLEHVNRLLDLMVTADPGARRAVSNIQILARQAGVLVAKEYTPVDPNIRQPCHYCGTGVYVLRVKGCDSAVSNFGFNRVGAADWRILTCDTCGHVQLFRVDVAARKDWWRAE